MYFGIAHNKQEFGIWLIFHSPNHDVAGPARVQGFPWQMPEVLATTVCEFPNLGDSGYVCCQSRYEKQKKSGNKICCRCKIRNRFFFICLKTDRHRLMIHQMGRLVQVAA